MEALGKEYERHQENTEKEQPKENYFDKQPKLIGNEKSGWRELLSKGIGTFVIIAAGIAFYFLFYRLGSIFHGLGKALSALKPVLYGVAIAYLLTPFVNFYDKVIVKFLEKHFKFKKPNTVARVISVIVAVLLLIWIVLMVFNLLIPQLAANIQNAVVTVPGQIGRLANKLQAAAGDSKYKAILSDLMEQGSTSLRDWLTDTLLPKTNQLMEMATSSVITVLKEVFYILIGLIVSIYLLYSKEIYAAQAKKATYALFTTSRATNYIHVGRKANQVFSGFILGKIVDSLIIGVLCFLGLSVISIWYPMPYISMISVVIGVTNIIPFFGPYLGAIPCGLLIALSSPAKAIVFVIFILALQQLDGNFIGPKILGNSTGLSSFWVIFAILLFGGLFGFIGMVLGVPTFAMIYYLVELTINQKLEAKGLPIGSVYYDPDSYVDEDGHYVSAYPDMPRDGSLTPSGLDDIEPEEEDPAEKDNPPAEEEKPPADEE